MLQQIGELGIFFDFYLNFINQKGVVIIVDYLKTNLSYFLNVKFISFIACDCNHY